MDLSPFLKSVEILSDLADPEIALLAENSQYLEFTDGAPIIKLERSAVSSGSSMMGSGSHTPLPRRHGRRRSPPWRGGPSSGDVHHDRRAGHGQRRVGWSSKLIRIPREIISRVVATIPKTLAKLTKIITRRLLADERILAEQEKACVALREQ